MRQLPQVPVCLRPHAWPLQLHLILFAAAILLTAVQAESPTKLYLVCQQSDTLKFSAWPIPPEDEKSLEHDIQSKSYVTQYCGISDLKLVPPLLRFVKVKTFHDDDSPKEVFHKSTDVIVADSALSAELGGIRWRGPKARARRQVGYGARGHFRGQTQSQYLAIDRGSGKDDGKAEAHSDADTSRASVISGGSGGMGQAQSQSVYDPSCDECHGRSELGPESFRTPTQGGPGTQFGRGSHGSNQGGPGIGYGPHQGGSGVFTPGQGTQGGNYNDPNGSGIPGSGTNGGLDGREGNTHGPHGQGNGDGSGGNGPGGPGGPGQSQRSGSDGQYLPGQNGAVGNGVAPGQLSEPSRNSGFIPSGIGGNGLGGNGLGQTSPVGNWPRQTGGTGAGTNGGYPGQTGPGGSGGYTPRQTGTGGYWPGPTGTGGYGPGQNSGTEGNNGYVPGQTGIGGSGGYGPGQTRSQGGNDGYGPRQTSGLGGNNGYRPGQAGPEGSVGYGPGQTGSQGGNNGYGPGEHSSYGPGQMGTGGNGRYEPGQTGAQGENNGYDPRQTGDSGQSSGPGGPNRYGPEQTGGSGGNNGYSPGQTGNGGSGRYGPSQTQGQAGNNWYGPGQTGGTGGQGVFGSGPNASGGPGGSDLQTGGGNYHPGSASGNPIGTAVYQGMMPGTSGPLQGTGGRQYICCVVDPNGNPQYLGLGGGSSNGPNVPFGTGNTGGTYGPSGQYGPTSTGGTGQYGNGPFGSGGLQGQTGTPSGGYNLIGTVGGPPGTTGGRNGGYTPTGTPVGPMVGYDQAGIIGGPYVGYGPTGTAGGPRGGYGRPSSTPGGPTDGFSQIGIPGRPSGGFGQVGTTGVPNGPYGPSGTAVGPNSGFNPSGTTGPNRGYGLTGTSGGPNGPYGPTGIAGGPNGGSGGPGGYDPTGTAGGPNSGPTGGPNGGSIRGPIGGYGPTGTAGGPNSGLTGGPNGGSTGGPGGYDPTGTAGGPNSGPTGGLNGGSIRGPIGGYGPTGTAGGPNSGLTGGPNGGSTGGPGGYDPTGTAGGPNSGPTGGPNGGSTRGPIGGYGPTGTAGGPNSGLTGGPNGGSTGGPGGFDPTGTAGGPIGGPTGGPNGGSTRGPIGGYGPTGTAGGPNSGLTGGSNRGSTGEPYGGYGPPGSTGGYDMAGTPGRPNAGYDMTGTVGGPSSGYVPTGLAGGPNGGYSPLGGPSGGYNPAGTAGGPNNGPNGNGGYGINQWIPGTNGDTSGVPQNVVDPNSVVSDADGDDSQAETSVSQASNGTIAIASSKGGNEKGRAQTQVQGAYTGSGSFSAQAEITGENKAANSEVTGDKKGASSNAQGSGRNNKSQASVKLGSETGSILTGSQSDGAMHSSNTQVQGSVKGGMADAQARGPGSTSSQAQIGFTPYKEGDKSHDLLTNPFVGGGTSSAQSSGRTGMSQSQLRGTFKYGITYNGAAQSGASVDKAAVFPNRLPFDKIDVYDESNKNINVDLLKLAPPEPLPEIVDSEASSTNVIPSTDIPFSERVTTERVIETSRINLDQDDPHPHSDHHKTKTEPLNANRTPSEENRRSFQPTFSTNSADYDYNAGKDDNLPEEYDIDDGYGTEGNDAPEAEQGEYTGYNKISSNSATHQSLNSPKRKGVEVRQTTGGNTQHILLGSLHEQDAEITQQNSERPNEKRTYQPGERVPGTGGYTIPIGFTGSVKSVASKDETYVIGSKDSPSQAQTVSLSPGTGKIRYTNPSYYRSRTVNPKDLRSLYNPKPDDNSYLSVSKSVTRSLDDENNIRKQYSHTYYTKSSSCGYFTFTCTMVSGSDGRKKVCKPKIPTNPDGSPMRC